MITFMYFSPTGNAAYIAGQLAKTMESMTEDKVLLLPMEHTDCQALEALIIWSYYFQFMLLAHRGWFLRS